MIEDAIEFHTFAPLESSKRVTNSIPLRCSPLLPVGTVISVQTLKAAIELGTGAKNSYPLKGGYTTNWEGGVRAPGWVNGGFLPDTARGSKVEGYIHLADFYATFCGLAGVDPTDATGAAAKLPPIDSMDMWPLLSGANHTSPRTEFMLTSMTDPVYNDKAYPTGGDAAYIAGPWKLILNNVHGVRFSTGIYTRGCHWIPRMFA
jgi:hypothetical protein